MENEYWTLGPGGHVPKQPIMCHHCGHEMVRRWSQVFIPLDVKHVIKRAQQKGQIDPETARDLITKHGWAEDIEYKCPVCQIVKVFGIPLSNEDREYIGQTREHSLEIPIDEWLENEVLAKKLKDLGYW